MLRLVPEWTRHYDEFWTAIKRRNLWFIKLRYFFVILLIIFLIGIEFVLDLNLSITQFCAIVCVAVVILIYNVILQIVRRKVGCVIGKFNCMHLSLIQMILDLVALMVLIYFTGTIDSPLYMFFIFQLIIGSMILPGYVVYTIAIFISGIFSTLVFLQYFKVIESHLISGLFYTPPSHHFAFVVLFLVVFGSMLIFSVYLTNKIAHSLYLREQQLRETLNQLNEAETAKQKYIMGVVHEIKTPISAVQSLLDVILQNFLGPISDELTEKLKRAKIRTSESLHLINNILRISKLKLLNITSSEELYISELVQEIIEKQQEYAKSRNISIKFIDKRDKPKIIYGDKVLVELAFSNIIGNAIKYNLEGGNIEVIFEDEDGYIGIEVCDDGIGIPKEDSEKIFNQFFRASNIKNSSAEGSGLGLSLVMEIIERYQGTITVESPSRMGAAKRPGTCFTIKWPYHEVTAVPKKKHLTTFEEGL
ncbi:sensor histidine kinase [Bacteroidota bacterium]